MSDKLCLAGVIGDPVAHSKSPALHGHWIARYGINGYYIPMTVGHEALPRVLKTLPEMGFRGVNITIPHKELALSLADTVTDRAALIGAANTLTFTATGTVQADNTDGYGFIENVRHSIPDLALDVAPSLVLGAGGASRAVISALLGQGAPKVYVANRTRARADVLRDHFGARVESLDWTRIPDSLANVAMVVNTTSLGMDGRTALNVDLTRLKSDTIVADLVYTPLRTEFLEAAAARGCRTVDGLGMLLHQAVPGFERWFGKTPEVDDALRRAVLGA
ncbi:MAG: shikimate dehydrogenase [Pseudomonadota bacterium]